MLQLLVENIEQEKFTPAVFQQLHLVSDLPPTTSNVFSPFLHSADSAFHPPRDGK